MLFLVFSQSVNERLHFSHVEVTLITKGKLIFGQFDSVPYYIYVKFLFWYIARGWNYGILATPARIIIKARLKMANSLTERFSSSRFERSFQVIPGNDQNTTPTNQGTAGSKHLADVLWRSQRHLKSFSGRLLVRIRSLG